MDKVKVLQALSASVFAVLCAVSVNFSVKYAAEQGTPQHMILFFRFVGGMLLILPILFYCGERSYKSSVPLLQASRALMITLSIAMFFWTIAVMPVGIAGAIKNSGPLFIPLGAILFLGERARLKLFIPVSIGLVGAILATENAMPEKGSLALVVGLLSAAIGGLTTPWGKYLQRHDDLLVLVTWPAFGGIILATGWVAVAGFTMPGLLVVLSLSVAGVFGYLAWFLIQWAYQTLSSRSIAPVKYLAIPFNLLGGLIFFGEVFTPLTLFGIGLILFACLLPWLEFKTIRTQLEILQRWLPPK